STISPGDAAPSSTSSRTRSATCRASARRQCRPLPEYVALSVTSSSTGCPNTGSGNSPDAASGWKPSPNSGPKRWLTAASTSGRAAVVRWQRQPPRRGRAPLAEDLDVRVPEAVDRLELVANIEDLLLGAACEQVDHLALQRVRVLELVDHERAEAQLLGLADA